MSTPGEFTNLYQAFLASVDRYPERPALKVDGRVYTYQELHTESRRIAGTIRAKDPSPTNLRAAFLAYRSATAYAAVLGILGAGKGYVPLHPGFPLARTQRMLELSGVDVLIVGDEAMETLREPISGWP